MGARRLVSDYQVRIVRTELETLQLSAMDQAFVLCIVSRNEDSLTMNLKSPVIINLDRRLGRQVITNDDQPMQYRLAGSTAPLRKSA